MASTHIEMEFKDFLKEVSLQARKSLKITEYSKIPPQGEIRKLLKRIYRGELAVLCNSEIYNKTAVLDFENNKIFVFPLHFELLRKI